MRTRTVSTLAVVSLALSACDGRAGSRSPVAPTTMAPSTPPLAPVPQPDASQLAVFTDPITGYSTSDVHDVDGEIIRVNLANELIWAADDRRFPEFIASANFIAYHHATDKFFAIRFGTQNGVPRAYVTWPDERLHGSTVTILDLWIDGRGDLKVAETDVPVPAT